MDKELLNAAEIALKDCLRVQIGEKLLIVTDTVLKEIGIALRDAGKTLGLDPVLIEILPRERNGEEPPELVTHAMIKSDVVIAPTSKSLTHTEARRKACAEGARVATMPGITKETMVRCLNADYYKIAARTEKLAEMLSKGDVIHVTSPSGTDITLPIKGIKAIPSTGLFHEPGKFGNLPSGEAYLMPEEGKSNGVFVVDGSMAGIGNLEGKQPIKVKVKNGMAVEISGGPEADELQAKLSAVGEKAFNVAEFGVGTNDAAKIIGNILEDEKVMGTIHIALGNNMSMGGTVNVPIHLDGIIKNPSFELDGKPIMKDGQLII